MSLPTEVQDRTGTKIVPKEGLVDIDVIAREQTTGIYLVQDVLKSDPDMKAAPYFVSTDGLEDMVKFFETGEWASGI